VRAANALQSEASTPVGPRATQAKRCGVCQRTYEPEAWKSLPAVTTLPAAAIKPHLSVPAEWALEIRTCTCGSVLASLCR
jgi:hypothetical protein